MQEILNTTVLGLFFGTIGTTIGGIIGCVMNNKSDKFLSFILSFAAGLMMAVVCFNLIPESLEISKISEAILGILAGIIVMIFCDIIVDKKFNKKSYNKNVKSNLLKTGIIVSIGLAIHNIPEGLAIGSGFDASIKLGYSLALAIWFHDIPEEIFQNRYQVRNAWETIWIQKHSTPIWHLWYILPNVNQKWQNSI